MNALPRSAPEAEGLSSAVIRRWEEVIDQMEYVHSFMILRHGKVIAEAWRAPYAPQWRHRLYSVSKSFTSAGIGLAISEGRLTLDDPVYKFFPEVAAAEISPAMQKVTVRHLLTMTSGHADCAFAALTQEEFDNGDWVRIFLCSALTYEPGTRFAYNSGGTYMLASILRKVTGVSLIDYLRPRLFAPLGIEELKWERCPRGTCIGGWGFNLKTEDMAKFGQLLLQNGNWNGQQILPADYLQMAVSKQSDNSMNENPDWKLGYGFQFWRSQHNCFRGDGWSGQYILVMPEQDMVLAMTAGMADMQRILNAVWEIIIPAVRPGGAIALPADAEGQAALRRFAAGWKFSPAGGDWERRGENAVYRLADNTLGYKSIKVEFTTECCVLTFDGPRGAEKMTAGFGHFADNRLQLTDYEISGAAASAGWSAPDTLEIFTVSYETPFQTVYTLRFADDALTLDAKANLYFVSEPWPPLSGVRQ